METLDPIESAELAPADGDGGHRDGADPDGAGREAAIERLEDELSELVDEISGDLVAINRDLSELVELRRGLDFDFERLEASLGLRGRSDPAEPDWPRDDAPAETAPSTDGDVRFARDGHEHRIALTMAINGASREEAAGYLANNFDLSAAERDRLLGYVYDCVDALRASPPSP